MKHALVLLACAGCKQVFGLDEPTVGAPGDAARDVPGDQSGSGDASLCYGVGLVRACFSAPPSGKYAPGASTSIDTDGSSCAALTNTNSLCAIAATDMSINHNLSAHGSRPLVLIATDTISINEVIDVASHRGMLDGAAANAVGCANGTLPSGEGGGAGGSYGGAGGAGGNDGSGIGGIAGSAHPASSLAGGCPGQDGGGTPGSGGSGGGAVYLIAGTQISIGPAGRINASGAGGAGGIATNNGGGGGGSGGLIGLEAPIIGNDGVVFASGGGGGEGSTTNDGLAGAEASAAMLAPAGGTGGTTGGSGGSGSSGGTGTAGGSVGNAAGGGGGGGGAGHVRVFVGAVTGTGSVSPPPM